MMKIALVTSAALIAGSNFVAQPAKAEQKWCAVMNLGDLAENCHFVSRAQCQASLTATLISVVRRITPKIAGLTRTAVEKRRQ